ncbi:MAG: response regulator [bacterium]
MAQLFISYAKADSNLAEDLAKALEGRGYTTWYFERDSVPGLSYLLQTGQAIKASSAFIVLISHTSLASNQVTKEIVRAHEESKAFLPILCGITHLEFQNQQQEWREALGSAASVVLPPDGALGILPRLERGLAALKITPETHGGDQSTGPDATLQRNGATNPLDKTKLQDLRMVIVDDEEVVRIMISIQLERCGVIVRTAESGEEGLAVIQDFRPNVVVTDMCMPGGMNGFELIKRVRANPELRQTAFLLISGYLDAINQSMLQEEEVTFLAKPFTWREFIAVLLELTHPLKSSSQKTVPNNSAFASMSASVPTSPMGPGDKETLLECTFVFTERCRGHLATLGTSEADVLALVQGEFRSHTNYLRFDLENYPLPLRSGYIAYLTKTGQQVEFTGFIKCTADQAKLASWNDILALYRRATRLAYRSDPQKLFLVHGALGRAIELHVDLRTRITKHFTDFERLPVEERVFLMDRATTGGGVSSGEAMADEVAYQLRESARATNEASKVEQMLELGDMTFGDAVGTCVMEMERSLQHLHKIITGYPPIA